MTPTLIGRWQTRIVLLATIGVLVSAVLALSYGATQFFLVLGYVAVFGIIWDVIYIQVQRLRWDRDWPAAFQVATGVVEGVFLYAVLATIGLPGIEAGFIPPGIFALHYGLVWLVSFVWVQGPMRVVAPFWRFHGGRIWPAVASRERQRG